MKFKNLSEISSSIRRWKEITTNPEDTLAFLDSGNRFTFKRTQEKASNLHVYPGIYTEGGVKKLYVFLIAEEDDNDRNDDQYLFDAIIQCEVGYDGLQENPEEITEEKAKKRINSWNKNHVAWINDQFKTGTPIFRAFHLPSSYIEKDRLYKTYFSLRDNDAFNVRYTADLITVDGFTRENPSFYDTVRPVPPFDVFPEKTFYLLNK